MIKYNKEFWLKAGNRAFRTFAQTAVAMIPVAVSVVEVNWLAVFGTAILSAIVSVLTSIATGLPEVDELK